MRSWLNQDSSIYILILYILSYKKRNKQTISNLIIGVFPLLGRFFCFNWKVLVIFFSFNRLTAIVLGKAKKRFTPTLSLRTDPKFHCRIFRFFLLFPLISCNLPAMLFLKLFIKWIIFLNLVHMS